MKTLLKPLSLALFVAATLPTQSAYIRTSPPANTIIPATGPSSHFCKAIGGKKLEAGVSLIQTSDGGYAITGLTKSFSAGGHDVYVVKLDATGNLQWTKTIGGPESEEGNSLIQTSDGGYAITGFTESFGTGELDVYVVKLDANGNLQWTKTIGGPESDGGNSLTKTSDGGYAIAGYTSSFGAGEWDVYVVKLDANGNLQWTTTIGGKKEDIGASLIQTSDGGYAIAGFTQSFGAGEVGCLCRQAGCRRKPPMDHNHRRKKRGRGQNPSFRPPMAATPSPAAPNPSAQEKPTSMSSSWMPMVTSNGPELSADQAMKIGFSLIQTSDGGYVIAGTTASFGAGGSRCLSHQAGCHWKPPMDQNHRRTRT
jgi:hypothetical protein